MKNYNEIISILYDLLNEVKDKLRPEDEMYIKEFIEHNELGLAYETLCTQIYEYGVQISPTSYEKIIFCGNSMGIEPSMWLPLKELIKYE
jgi:hypothetical protein